MSKPKISTESEAPISSLGSADGHSLSSSPAGRKTRRSGRDRAHVSHSPSLVKSKERLTSATYGQNSSDSSESAVLQSFLESRLRAGLAAYGSPEYVLTWKAWAMQSGGADLCAASVSAPHRRQRLYWVADANGERFKEWEKQNGGKEESELKASRLGNSIGCRSASRLVNANGYHKHWWSGPVQVGRSGCQATIKRGGREYRAQWRIKPGLSIVAHGVPGRVGKLCAFGNAIVPQVAAEFIKAYISCLPR